MVDDIIEAIATIVGIGFAGWLLYVIGEDMPTEGPVDLQMMGVLFIAMALIATAAILYFAAKAVSPR